MADSETTRRSKFLALVLRHRPERIGLTLDSGGWVPVDELLAALGRHERAMTCAELEPIVRTDDKSRYAFSPDGLRIRASQGHSKPVDLGYEPASPPEELYHGTVARFLSSIRTKGLLRGERHHVHLSETRDAARQVGGRRGVPVVIAIRAGEMARDGFVFYRSANGVRFTEHVPARYLTIPRRG